VVVAANGLIGDLVPAIAARLLPLDNTIVATAPLAGDTLARLIPGGEAVADTRRVVRYWRPAAGGRLVFGGGERYTRREPRDIAGFVRPFLAEVYPQLASVEIEHAWSGTLAITRTRCPLIGEVAPGLYTGCGYSGHGLGTATFAGKAIAEAICGDRSTLEGFAVLPVPAFPGGARLRAPLLALAMGLSALRDRL
jgi:gamma-glutamylputrescine oxidase